MTMGTAPAFVTSCRMRENILYNCTEYWLLALLPPNWLRQSLSPWCQMMPAGMRLCCAMAVFQKSRATAK